MLTDRERALAMAYRVRATDWPNRAEAIADAILEARAQEADLCFGTEFGGGSKRAAELRSQKEPGC